jgi:nucleoid-associated protein YgaU
MEEILRDLARLRNYAAGLQQVMADFQQAAPERSQGTDRSGAVRAVLGADGLPEAIRVDAHWGNRLRAGSFGAAVVEASETAMRERGAAWSRALKGSDWQRRVDLLEAGPASADAVDPGTVLPFFATTWALEMGVGVQSRNLQQAGELSETFPNDTWPQAVASIASFSPSAGDGTYTVRPGDNLYDIAGRKLGDPNLWPEIQAANPQLVSAAGTPIYPGQVLRIPRLGRPADGDAPDALGGLTPGSCQVPPGNC